MKKIKNELKNKSFRFTTTTLLGFLLLFSALLTSKTNAQNLPPGFSQVLVASGITSPSAIAFAPDGRIFVAEKTGALRIIKNGNLLPQPFITLSVSSSGERGLVGIAFHPNFTSNHYIYLYHTLASGDHNRISRFIASGDTVVPGSEIIILDLEPLGGALIHNAGSMAFGPDGKLYVGVGDATQPFNSQDLDSYNGKILRLNSDGSVPPGNPFPTGSKQRKRVWAYGLRNPFTFSFQTGTGRLFVNEVGQDAWDEINEATTPGLNFGWPYAEGNDTTNTYTDPVFTYHHGTGLDSGCAVTGGTFFNPAVTNWPASYFGKYFFVDYCNYWMDMLSLNGAVATKSQFASNIADYALGLTTGPDGNLYFLSFYNDAVYKIVYNTSQAPLITNQPQSLTVSQGNPATFTVSVTGDQPLTYQWKKNGTNITGAKNKTYTIPAVDYSDTANYTVKITNSLGNVTSNIAKLTVTPANDLPVAIINTPVAGATYAGGSIINYSGTATDTEDGTLGGAAFNWYLIFHHDTHSHPGPTVPSGVTNGSFSIPVSGETSSNVYYRLYLVVTDSQGAKDTAYVDIFPRTTNITLNTDPQGLIVNLDGQPHTTPYIFTGVEGIERTISVVSPQSSGGNSWFFNNWSQGKGQTQTFSTPVSNANYIATFTTTVTAVIAPVADSYIRSGIYGDINYGNSDLLYTKNATSNPDNIQKVFLKFNISSLGNNLGSVKLRMLGNMANTSPSATVQVVNVPSQSWQENTITWNSHPSAQTIVLDAATVNGKKPSYYEWDITQQVNNLLGSGSNFISLMVKNLTVTNNNYAIFNSKENVNGPELRITTNGAFAENLPEKVSGKNVQEDIFRFYPNPAAGSFTIFFSPGLQHGSLKITDLNGRIVKEVILTTTDRQNVMVEDLKTGMYFLSVTSGDKIYYEKIAITQ